MPYNHDNCSLWQSSVKRIADTVTAILFGIVMLPFTILLAMILLACGFRLRLAPSRHYGMRRRPFTAYSIIQAKPRASTAALINIVGGILSIGLFRDFPRILNIIRGDMSIVGPRLLTTAEGDRVLEEFPEYSIIQNVRPGIISESCLHTDQYAGYVSLCPHIISLDIRYIENRTISLDMQILSDYLFSSLSHNSKLTTAAKH